MLQDWSLQAKIAKLNDPRVSALSDEAVKLLEQDSSSTLGLDKLKRLNLIFLAPDEKVQNMVLPVLLPGSSTDTKIQNIARLSEFVEQGRATQDQTNYIARCFFRSFEG